MLEESETILATSSSLIKNGDVQQVQKDDEDDYGQIMVRDLDSGTLSCFGQLSQCDAQILSPLKKMSVWQDYWKERENNKHLLLKMVTENKWEMLQTILKNKEEEIDINQYIYLDGWTLLHHAVNKKCEKIVDVLIRNGCNVNKQTESMKSTPLHLAVMEKQDAIVQMLLRNGANPNIEDIDFCTPLHYAAQYSLFDIVRIMLNNDKTKINFQIKNNKNMTIADCCRDPRIKQLMKKYCARHQCALENNNHLSRTIETLDGRVLLTRSRTDLIERILHKVESSNSDDTPPNELQKSNELRPLQALHRIKSQKLKNVHHMAKLSLSYYKNYLLQQTVQSLQHYDVIKKLGSGSFGTVFLIRKKHSSKLFALKRMKKQVIKENSIEKYIYAEREVLKNFKHPFILHAGSFFQDDTYVYMVMDFCSGGDMQRKIVKGKFSQELAKKYCCEAVLALEELHKQNYLFRDLKASNVLIDGEGHIKLADFGLAKKSEMSQSFLGSICYVAPEMLVDSQHKPHSAAIDWYLLGVFVYEMLTGLPPFYCEDQGVMLDLIRHARPKIPGYIGEECKSFLLKTLAKKPNDRLGNKGAEEVKNHDWFKDIDWILVLNRGLEMETPLVNQKQLRAKEYIEKESIDKEKSKNNHFENWDYKEDEGK